MYYPWWHVPFLTGPMLIALVATIHVLVSHYAVGGGFFLAVETAHAYRTRNTEYLAYLKRHAWFFVLLTVVFGAITGVGIWWIIGLASPLATQTLIQTFVFGWAMEYCFFIVEVVSAFVFFYGWDKLKERTHVQVLWIYAIAAWVSLVLITGITAFMLNSGDWSLTHNRDFWTAFFNPQFVPQTLARTGGAFLLASLYVYLHAALFEKNPKLRDLIAKRSARPGLVGAVLIVLGGVSWLAFLPPSALAALKSAAPLNLLVAALFALTVAVFAMLFLGPYRNPGWLSTGFGILMLAMGFGAITTGEFIREAVRKPYVVYNVVYGNQTFADHQQEYRTAGLLQSGVWTRAYLEQHYRDVVTNGRVDMEKIQGLPATDRLAVGRLLFQYSCSQCHADKDGFAAVAHLTQGWTPDLVTAVCRHPEQVKFFMPPFPGTTAEADLLADYVRSIQEPAPTGMNPALPTVAAATAGAPQVKE